MKFNALPVIGGNSKVLRNMNRAMILNIIRVLQPISRIKISKMTGLNKSTVSSIVSDLLEEEFIIEKVDEDQNVGRNPINLSLKLRKHLVGAINIDSFVTRFAIADIDGSILTKSKIETNPSKNEDFIKECIDEIKRLSRDVNHEDLSNLGVSIAGIVDSKNLVVEYAPNLGWEKFEIGKIIKNEWPELGSLAVGNDAKSSALAESWFGTHDVNLSNFVFLSIGPGIGSGIVVDNKILNGEFQASGEFGHMTIYEDGEKCSCENYGCWEAYASDKATVDRFKKDSGEEDLEIDIQQIINLAKNGNELATNIIKKTGFYLGVGISNIIKTIDPHAIVIGGRITQMWNIVYPEIAKVVEKRAFFGNSKQITILPTSLKIRPRLLGAATLAIKEIFDDYKIMA